jgi:hypothetical protein
MSEETAGTESAESIETITPEKANEDLEAWASQKPSSSRLRSSDGKFRQADSESKQVSQALKDTVKQGSRPPPREEPEEQPQEEEEVEEEPRPRMQRKVKGIVNGVEEEIDIDDETFQKVNAVQATRAAQKAWREAAEMRKEANQLKRAIEDARAQVRQNPMVLFNALGIPEEDVLNFAQSATINKLAETIDPNTGQPYTPEQQRIIQLQKELQRKEQSEKTLQQQQEEAELEQIKNVVRQDIDRKFTSALEETGLPPTQYTMMRLADLMQSVGPDVDPKAVAPLVLEDMVNEVRATVYSMPMEVAVEVLGEEWLNELRKWDIARARAGKDKFGRNPRSIPQNAQRRPPPAKGGNMSTQEAEEWLEKWAQDR